MMIDWQEILRWYVKYISYHYRPYDKCWCELYQENCRIYLDEYQS